MCPIGSLQVSAQPATAAPDSIAPAKHIKLAAVGLAIGYTGMLVGLSQTWYEQSEKTSFHFFNDNPEWLQLDKAGHFWGAFHESRLGIEALRAARVPEQKAIIYGSLLGFALQSPIELLDGYAADYGASVGDLSANAAGSLAVLVQQLAWGELKILPKFSFHRTAYANLRPNVLGSNLPEELLKDYNGQTYWLTANISSFLPAQSAYPKWLNLALGYGGQRIVYGMPQENRQNGFDAYRQYYLALDLNLLHVKTRHKLLRTAFSLISMVHLPAPTLEYNRKKGFRFHPVYF
ncbi:DUF2279 domain-containing protein [Adhaeribacter aerolatus]|uniref:DUF2279 domain-containing protein n=1 Tax=Adhaeribacter aerolatus TaxID=670289 RepID=UPI001FE43C27|nr:DUF2279 domain-containing protein [Adhaeribacter aerolatus]